MATQDTKSPILANLIISPGFKSAAAMAGWDEEALLASLVVEDTPIRESRHSKRPKFKSSSNSKRKRRLRRQSIDPIPAVVLCLDDEEDDDGKRDNIFENKGKENAVVDEEDQKKNKERDSNEKDSSKGIACMDKLREELSCAICLEICYEPSTTQCGHSFCMKCLKHAASKCGKKCPKCRQLISNARSCTINTVLWNTIQLLFPEDIEARKKAVSTKPDSAEPANHRTQTSRNTRVMPRSSTNSLTAAQTQTTRNRSIMPRSTNFTTAAQVISAIERDIESSVSRRRRALLTQNQDAELALRLQREEYMEAQSSENGNSSRRSIDSARANLRAMASSRYHIRTRGRY